MSAAERMSMKFELTESADAKGVFLTRNTLVGLPAFQDDMISDNNS